MTTTTGAATMSAAEVLAEMDGLYRSLHDGRFYDDYDAAAQQLGRLRDARAAVSAMAEREAALVKACEAHAKRIAELEEDFRRIEWLALNPRGASTIIDGKARRCVFWGVSSAPENTLRQAIDAARAEARDG